MADSFFSGFWDPYQQRRPQRSPYSSHPYAAANVTPTRPEYDYLGAPKVKPRTFTVPVHGPNENPSPVSGSVTNRNSSAKPNSKKVFSIPIDSDSPISSGIKKAVVPAVPRMNETSAAIKLQSAFRGFSARKGSPLKNLRVIRDVRAHGEDIRRRLADRQVVESILQNEKERLKMTEEIMSLLLKLDAIQGVTSFVRESRKSVIRELLYLQEIVDNIFAGKSIEGTGSMGSESAEDKHGDELAASVEGNGDVQCLENVEEIRDEELLERCSNVEEKTDEEVLDGIKLGVVSADDFEVQEEGSVISDKIERQTMQIECPNHIEDITMGTVNGGGESSEVIVSKETEDITMGTGNGGGELSEVIVSNEDELDDQERDEEVLNESERQDMHVETSNHTEDIPMGTDSNGGQTSEVVAAKENKLEYLELEPHDEEEMRDSVNEENCTDGAASCEGQSGEELRASESQSIPCTNDEDIRHSIEEKKFANSPSDCEVQKCRMFQDFDLSLVETQTIQASEQHSEVEGMDCEGTEEAENAGASKNANDGGDNVKVKGENQRLKKTVVDLIKKIDLQTNLINNLSLRIAQLEDQVSKSKRKKTKKTCNGTTGRRNTE